MKCVLLFCVTLCLGFAFTDGVVMCYWGSWANRRPGLARFGVDDLRPDLCTHIIYSFMGVGATGNLVYYDVSIIDGKSNNLADLVRLKDNHRNLKTLIAVGGWEEGSENFSIVANNATIRATFVSNVLSFLVQNNLDGIDVDWEYPAQRGGLATDKEAFIWLLEDLKASLQPRGLLVTAAVGVTQYNIDTSYYVANMSATLDYINLMTYDLNGWPYNVTGANAPLHPQLTDSAGSLNVVSLVNLWINSGASPSKLVLGLASYGRSFNLTSTSDVTTGALASGPGQAGVYTQEAGFLAYYEICIGQQENEWNITEVDGSYVYAQSGNFWIGYDNENTIRAKAQYAKTMGLGGIMFWAIDLDDFAGVCNGTDSYPLIRTAVGVYGNDAKQLNAGFIITFIVSLTGFVRQM